MNKYLVVACGLAASSLSSHATTPTSTNCNNCVLQYTFNYGLGNTQSEPWPAASNPGLGIVDANGVDFTTITGSDGSSAAGGFYSFSGGGGESSLGAIGSGGAYWGSPAEGAVAGYIIFGVTNRYALQFGSFTVNFTGEQWRDGGNTSAQTMVLEYGIGSTFAAVSQWNAAGSTFNWTTPVHTAVASALDGKAAANRVTNVGGTVGGLIWNPDDTLWLRWVVRNEPGEDHGMAIENLFFYATAAPSVPEPATYGLMLVGIGLLATRRCRLSSIEPWGRKD